jgi:hypothetical protein
MFCWLSRDIGEVPNGEVSVSSHCGYDRRSAQTMRYLIFNFIYLWMLWCLIFFFWLKFNFIFLKYNIKNIKKNYFVILIQWWSDLELSWRVVLPRFIYFIKIKRELSRNINIIKKKVLYIFYFKVYLKCYAQYITYAKSCKKFQKT